MKLHFRRMVWLTLVTLALAPLSWPAENGDGSAQILSRENIVESAKPKAAWSPAVEGALLGVADRVRTGISSRAALRLTNQSVMRLHELTTIEILPAPEIGQDGGIDLKQGVMYFFSREPKDKVKFSTPAVTGALRGTEFVLAVAADGRTVVTVLDGEVDISNSRGSVTVRSGEEGHARPGEAPVKTAMLEARNIIQWCLYYPAVLEADDFRTAKVSPLEHASLDAYRLGDLPEALRLIGGNPARVRDPLFAATLLLSSGQVERARVQLSRVPASDTRRRALERLIAAVTLEPAPEGDPASPAEWLATSYGFQAQGDLENARKAARQCVSDAPEFGHGWVRLAELEFSFGRTAAALDALEKGLKITPRNAQGHALRGFMLAANNEITKATGAFESAMEIDSALGNAWLGRGLCSIRRNDLQSGLRDLQTATVMEPQRALFRSYFAKSLATKGELPTARLELGRAQQIDAADPTPWLYQALLNKQENRVNAAVEDLEKSIHLNQNRRIFRSQFLLDQDKAVRGTNLATIYQLAGMPEVAVREASRAVTADYTSASAHLFLANSYNALRDPRRIVLRYETPFNSEMLLANLLSPVGGGPLSQYVSEQEYSKLFESDGFGMNSVTEYASTGQLREIGSLFGTFGNFSFSLDADYFWDAGHRTNNETSRFGETYAKMKFQLTPGDVLFLEASVQKLRSGDTRQLYNDDARNDSLRIEEDQYPGTLLAGLRHDWAPGIQTLVLAGRLATNFSLTSESAETTTLVFQGLDALAFFNPPPTGPEIRPDARFAGAYSYPFRERYDLDVVIGTGELQQIFTLGQHTIVAGVRYQDGTLHVRSVLEDRQTERSSAFTDPAAENDFDGELERLSVYLYDTFRVCPELTLIGGVTFDRLQYPSHFRVPPLEDTSREIQHWSPKLGFIFEPARWLRLRGAYMEAISGVTLDESTRLESTQIAGFNQGFRSLLNESVGGSVSAARYKILGAAAESKLPTRTYLGLEWNLLKQEHDTQFGAFDNIITRETIFNGTSSAARPGPGIGQQVDYEERAITATVNQLLGQRWSFGAAYRVTWSEFQTVLPELIDVPGSAIQHRDSELQQLDLAVNWNHESGFFARADALWTRQENNGFPAAKPGATKDPGDDFWQINAFTGYRFPRNRGELSVGVLNLFGGDYELEPLSPYAELAHERTLVVRCRLSF